MAQIAIRPIRDAAGCGAWSAQHKETNRELFQATSIRRGGSGNPGRPRGGGRPTAQPALVSFRCGRGGVKPADEPSRAGAQPARDRGGSGCSRAQSDHLPFIGGGCGREPDGAAGAQRAGQHSGSGPRAQPAPERGSGPGAQLPGQPSASAQAGWPGWAIACTPGARCRSELVQLLLSGLLSRHCPGRRRPLLDPALFRAQHGVRRGADHPDDDRHRAQ